MLSEVRNGERRALLLERALAGGADLEAALQQAAQAELWLTGALSSAKVLGVKTGYLALPSPAGARPEETTPEETPPAGPAPAGPAQAEPAPAEEHDPPRADTRGGVVPVVRAVETPAEEAPAKAADAPAESEPEPAPEADSREALPGSEAKPGRGPGADTLALLRRAGGLAGRGRRAPEADTLELVLRAVRRLGPEATNTQLAVFTGFPQNTVSKCLGQLEASGRLRREGKTKGRRLVPVAPPSQPQPAVPRAAPSAARAAAPSAGRAADRAAIEAAVAAGQVRRFDPGTAERLVIETLREAGMTVEPGVKGQWKLGAKLVEWRTLVARADTIRASRGLPTVRSQVDADRPGQGAVR